MQTIFREALVTLYLTLFKTIFSICHLFPQKNKTVFVSSFGDNIFFVLEEVRKTDSEIVFLSTNSSKNSAMHVDYPILKFNEKHVLDWIKSIYHIATAKIIFIDNYYGFLAATNFKKNVICVQLWHAAGAIKQFALKDPSNRQRSHRANARFQKVYNRFDKIVVGSEKMADIMKTSFGANDDRILRTGIPRTDFFYDIEKVAKAKQQLYDSIPTAKQKKVILYAPTFRENQSQLTKFHLDLNRMFEELKDDYILLVRAHPSVKMSFVDAFPGFLYDVSQIGHVNEILTITDILITDYSSIPFEFSLLKKPMYFFPYDLFEYMEERGFYEPYESLVPGPIAFETKELIRMIKENAYSPERLEQFQQQWNTYSTGDASYQLIQAIYPQETKEQDATILKE